MADGLLKPLLASKSRHLGVPGLMAGGGLYGYASVANVDMGTPFGYDAIAIADHVANNLPVQQCTMNPVIIHPNSGVR